MIVNSIAETKLALCTKLFDIFVVNAKHACIEQGKRTMIASSDCNAPSAVSAVDSTILLPLGCNTTPIRLSLAYSRTPCGFC
mmetsp:Transcript_19688/g.29399  ORF Transcript_19688/g.29399 Transcript_19688/m.29399 type:complete len:82 (-) Transcript_19688:9-254(-)